MQGTIRTVALLLSGVLAALLVLSHPGEVAATLHAVVDWVQVSEPVRLFCLLLGETVLSLGTWLLWIGCR